MPAPLTPAQRERLQRIADFIAEQIMAGTKSPRIIDQLVGQFGATFKPGASTNILRAGGVAASCTWSEDQGLLDAWRRLATIRLMA